MPGPSLSESLIEQETQSLPCHGSYAVEQWLEFLQNHPAGSSLAKDLLYHSTLNFSEEFCDIRISSRMQSLLTAGLERKVFALVKEFLFDSTKILRLSFGDHALLTPNDLLQQETQKKREYARLHFCASDFYHFLKTNNIWKEITQTSFH